MSVKSGPRVRVHRSTIDGPSAGTVIHGVCQENPIRFVPDRDDDPPDEFGSTGSESHRALGRMRYFSDRGGNNATADLGRVNMEVVVVIYLVVLVAVIAGTWKAFEKAGAPGWAAIIPIYNVYIMMKMAGKPGWWVLLCLIPIVNIVVLIIASLQIARNFAKSEGFGVGLALLSPIFWPILGFGDARWQVAPVQ